MHNSLIIALDFATEDEALSLIDKLDPSMCALKIGSELFTLLGPKFLKQLISRGFAIFLDLKFYDIPNTVARACAVAADLGVWMLTVHTSGGIDMLLAAKRKMDSYGSTRPLLIGVTVLTSFDAEDLSALGITATLPDHVKHLAHIAFNAGLDGVVSSAHEVAAIKHTFGSQFLTITPGIRLTNTEKDDQTRIVTPKQARFLGADHLVVGRPITQALDPLAVIAELQQ